ncbi:type II secretion system protein GspE [Mariprofundus erugo]|uniref:Type II secretion system protein E n=1 Tax=Mariprofundus erugo TaxID=2528639 RepID=A0A5R9GSS3_9PROT|nr:type II secretion system ATPase GspE [Mariprofundus erugo]TLS67307.1 type II secretion system protein GspE [Mariprofundus erugo]TLS74943.1 type II secretion system protein GspE [Mariprofundus erugo]
MLQLTRLTSDQVDAQRVAAFTLPVLRSGPLLPLKPLQGLANPVAVAVDAPWPWELLDDCRRLFGVEVQPVYLPREAILIALNQAFDMASASAEQMMEDLGIDELSREIEEVGDLLESEDDAPVIRLVNTLLSQALKERASDIHIEPFESRVLVRFRVDGVLHTIVHPPKAVQAALTSRIKVMAGLDIAEKRHPQDGRFRVKIAGREVDVRVSLLPTAYGERVVMRLLDRGAKMLTLAELGMSPAQLQTMQEVIGLPHGIVLVTGPTGSGKSTTLYAALMQVDRINRNVMTIEDPIEYQIEGVGQMQVQPKIGVSFAAGLRSILRQDPDIVMIGEIRDLETAEIAIQASLTGHLVFATLHTNDALSAIVRLQDMGVEPYLVASSLTMVQAQRLVRRLCPHCCTPRHPTADDWRLLESNPEDYAHVEQVYAAVGCDHCMGTGYIGRVAIYEITRISDAMRNLIHDGKGLPAMRRLARAEAMVTLRHDGARHVANGVTTIDEVLRVSLEDMLVVEV